MRKVRVFGPAYQDLITRVDRPLLGDGVVDGSFEGQETKTLGPTRIVDQVGGSIVIQEELPLGVEQLGRRVQIRGRLSDRPGTWTRTVRRRSTTESLGGMGAGFAAALRGELVSALGVKSFPWEYGKIPQWLKARGIPHRPILVPGREDDRTWIISSGGFGDKLAIGFRGCHAAVESLEAADLSLPCDLLVVAGFANRLIGQALGVPATIRMLAPAMRNMTEAAFPLASLAGRFDYLACNRAEWDALTDRAVILEKTPLVSVTDGPYGASISFHDRAGQPQALSLPAFPREAPPRDTNRAGEAFASTFIATLLDAGWTPGPSDPGLLRMAATRASAAASLVLDLEDFGFPSVEEIDHALQVGRVRRVAPG